MRASASFRSPRSRPGSPLAASARSPTALAPRRLRRRPRAQGARRRQLGRRPSPTSTSSSPSPPRRTAGPARKGQFQTTRARRRGVHPGRQAALRHPLAGGLPRPSRASTTSSPSARPRSPAAAGSSTSWSARPRATSPAARASASRPTTSTTRSSSRRSSPPASSSSPTSPLVATTRPRQAGKQGRSAATPSARSSTTPSSPSSPSSTGGAAVKPVWSSDKLPPMVVVAFPAAPAAERKAFQASLRQALRRRQQAGLHRGRPPVPQDRGRRRRLRAVIVDAYKRHPERQVCTRGRASRYFCSPCASARPSSPSSSRASPAGCWPLRVRDAARHARRRGQAAATRSPSPTRSETLIAEGKDTPADREFALKTIRAHEEPTRRVRLRARRRHRPRRAVARARAAPALVAEVETLGPRAAASSTPTSATARPPRMLGTLYVHGALRLARARRLRAGPRAARGPREGAPRGAREPPPPRRGATSRSAIPAPATPTSAAARRAATAPARRPAAPRPPRERRGACRLPRRCAACARSARRGDVHPARQRAARRYAPNALILPAR